VGCPVCGACYGCPGGLERRLALERWLVVHKKGAEPRSSKAVERASPRAQKAARRRASFEMVRGHDARSARADVSPEAARYPGTMNWEDTRRRGTKQTPAARRRETHSVTPSPIQQHILT